MATFHHYIAVAATLAFLTGCAYLPLKKGEQMLSAGIKNYEEGNYKKAAKNLQDSLDAGLSNKNDQVKAHKYMAFIHCASGRQSQCRDSFKKALEINPDFKLAPAEAGHPIWGPVFQGIRPQSIK